MALVAIPGALWIPLPLLSAGDGAAGFLGDVIDASTEKVTVVFRVPKTGILNRVEFRVGTVAVNAASQIRVSFQDVSATDGNPDGTLDQYRDIAGSAFVSNTWIVPGLMTSDGTDGGAKRSVTRGELLSYVIEYQTFTAADSINVSTINPSSAGVFHQAYSALFTGSWAKRNHLMVLALQYDDGSYGFVLGCHPFTTFNTVSLNTATTPDEVGMIFRFPASVKVGGAWVRYAAVGAGRDADIVLYDSDGSTVLETVSIDGDQTSSAGAGRNMGVVFPTDRQLSANVDYRLVVKPTTASSVSVYDATLNAQALLDGCEGGQNWHRTERTDAGAWTQTATKRPLMGLLVTALDDGVGAGGAAILTHPGGGAYRSRGL